MRLKLALTFLGVLLIWPVMGGRRGCGGTFTAARGIINTPNFPGPFDVPINCEWVIDAQLLTSSNTSIVVYLTQLFVFEGLTFTEYQLYGSDYKINARLIHRVNETNISRVRWVQTFQSFLVIRLKLPSADSAHLRVLDRFLDVFGFNITYEITTGTVRPNPCTMMDCGFTGICYDHYTKFSCECFHGYSGPNCSDGPQSYCYSNGVSICKNNATCLHVGVSAVKCYCPKGFTGNMCEIPVTISSAKECSTCRMACPFDGRLESACKCPGRSNASDPQVGDRTGFTTTMHFANLPNLDEENLKTYIQKQLLRNLQMNFSRVEDVSVINVVHFMSGADVTFHVFGLKKDEKRIRSILNKWADRGYIGNITISEKDTSLRTLLSLQSLAINQQGVIRERDEFILSCVARGSPTMTFRWFKDGVFVNVTSTSNISIHSEKYGDSEDEDQDYTSSNSSIRIRYYLKQMKDLRQNVSLEKSLAINQQGVIRERDEFILSCVARGSPTMTFRWFKDGVFVNVTSTSRKWIKLIKDPHIADQYTALLAVQSAHGYDEGTFTCQVEDFNIQQCLSKQVKVGRRPFVRVEPMSLTVRKGENFTIKCVTLEESGGVGGKYTYSWTKNKELLPVRTDLEKYEVLYPYGTILQVFSAEKDVQYSCLVQDETTSSEQGVPVYVVDREGVYTCPAEKFLGMFWPETAPDTNSILDCPKGYSGAAKRYCSLRDGRKPAWTLPSFSECTHRDLEHAFIKFKELTLGYTITTPEDVLQSFLNYLTKNKSRISLPGEGARILSLTREVVLYLKETKALHRPINNITDSVLGIVDRILLSHNSLTKPSEVRSLLDLISEHLTTTASALIARNGTETYHINRNTVDLTILNITYSSDDYFHIPSHTPDVQKEYKNWINVQFSGTNNIISPIHKPRIIAGIIFRNLSLFLPPRSFLRIKDGSELEYELHSQIVSVLPLPENFDIYPIAIDFKHELSNNLNWSNEDAWSVKCAYADPSTFTYTWDIYSCYTETLNDMKTRCMCPKAGIFALLLTMTPPKPVSEENNPRRYILIIGCSLCMLLALFTTACLATSCWMARRSCLVALKLQCSVSVFVIGLLFTLAAVTGPPQNYFMMFITTLEAFFLLGMSSHLSKLLVVFTELIQLPKPMASKYTVIGIISGVTIITVFGSHLAYRTMDIKLQSWWMVKETLAFNIFVAVTAVISVLFVFIYVTVMKKLRELMSVHEKHAKPIKKRVALIKRSGYLFGTVTLLSVSSIIYINNPDKMWSIYQFSIYNATVGLILLVCYIIRSETKFRNMFVSKPRTTSDDKFFSIDSTSSPLNYNESLVKFLTKQDAEVENECGPHTKPDCQQFTLRGSEFPKPAAVSKSQSITATFESCLHTSTSFCDSHKEGTSTPRRDKSQPPLEHYSSSPQTFRKYPNVTACSHSPDILATKVCVELDLVASSLQSSGKLHPIATNEPPRRIVYPPKVVITPDDAIAKILESETVVVQSDHERTQPDGHDESVTVEKAVKTLDEGIKTIEEEGDEEATTVTPPGNGDKLDGMLDSICHDLDYLLNRSGEVEAVATSSLRRVSKPPGASVKHRIPEELLKDETVNIPESITLRTNC
ncbi:LOW QUALITY PROTEIN: uncharacterized protein LOC108910229 [Anoplophora glabripennis]|uniref:LOW QUALITY PROTEIN: uncharacterized protein LOC108910229 n=1 Tax=Anoplophora glabripennis TaxID=217634 RepID=UPI000C76CB21|nr:LOW QUALITY PROTEIN: uncharacterized protein LOC108910229 [Anoplophora glabripennis]